MVFTELVGGIGITGACMVCLAIWVNKQVEYNQKTTKEMIDILREDNKEDKEKMLEEIAYNREVNSKLLTSNEVLAKEISTKLDYLLERIDK